MASSDRARLQALLLSWIDSWADRHISIKIHVAGQKRSIELQMPPRAGRRRPVGRAASR
jgi:hypothetical protein